MCFQIIVVDAVQNDWQRGCVRTLKWLHLYTGETIDVLTRT